jgi:hypothetical protein
MGFAQARVAATDAGREVIPEFEFVELAVDAVAVAAGDQTQGVAASKLLEDATCAGQKFWAMFGVVLAPDLIGSVVFGAGKIGGAIDVVPVGGTMLFEFGEAPGNLHFSEHGEVGGGVRGVGVEESAVPVEEDAFERAIAGVFHGML